MLHRVLRLQHAHSPFEEVVSNRVAHRLRLQVDRVFLGPVDEVVLDRVLLVQPLGVDPVEPPNRDARTAACDAVVLILWVIAFSCPATFSIHIMFLFPAYIYLS